MNSGEYGKAQTCADAAETGSELDELIMEMDGGILDTLCSETGFRAVTAGGVVVTADSNESLQAIINAMDELREERNAAITLMTDWADRYAQLVRTVTEERFSKAAKPEGFSGGDSWD